MGGIEFCYKNLKTYPLHTFNLLKISEAHYQPRTCAINRQRIRIVYTMWGTIIDKTNDGAFGEKDKFGVLSEDVNIKQRDLRYRYANNLYKNDE